ncbi:hypothetical protein SLS60_005989 [Paraconiothyrium brasiliense]|uniref:Uncharacterized protein n=1 Tax=Paraconiothyrium brasiliense TaxID=300254 RepID=A0ABR3RDR7_9PLEO
MRQLVPSRGGRRKSRPYPGLQIEGLPKPPQNQYQQAMAYVDGIVRKTTDTLLMLPTDMGARQEIPEDLRGNKPVSTLTHSKIAPPSPILQSLQSNREGGYFSITPGLRDAERQQGMMSRHTSQAASSERAAESQEFYGKDNVARTPGEQEIVEAMQGLKIFSGLRPGSRQSPSSLFEASVPLKKRHVNNPACATLATTDTQAYRETSIASVAESSNTYRETLCPQEVAEFDQAALGKVAYDDEITRHITDKTTPPAALPESTPEQNVPQDTVQVVKSATKATDKNGSFEDLSLDSPTSDSSASSVESARSDDDFEKVNAEIYETLRNGQPSAWTNWI